MKLRNINLINKGFHDINPLISGWEKCDPDHAYGPVARSYWLLHFVISGKGEFTTPRGKYSLQKNDMFIIRPYEITHYKADSNDPWTYVWIGFISHTQLPMQLTSGDHLHAPYLYPIFNSCSNIAENEKNGNEYLICSRIWEIIGLLQSDKDASAQFERYIKPALNIMEAEMCQGITVSQIAKRLHLNRSYFSVIFKESMGVSAVDYLSDLRMKRAASLLTAHNLSVSITALSVGYSDVFVFSRAFKKHFGVAPNNYKKLNPDAR